MLSKFGHLDKGIVRRLASERFACSRVFKTRPGSDVCKHVEEGHWIVQPLKVVICLRVFSRYLDLSVFHKWAICFSDGAATRK